MTQTTPEAMTMAAEMVKKLITGGQMKDPTIIPVIIMQIGGALGGMQPTTAAMTVDMINLMISNGQLTDPSTIPGLLQSIGGALGGMQVTIPPAPAPVVATAPMTAPFPVAAVAPRVGAKRGPKPKIKVEAADVGAQATPPVPVYQPEQAAPQHIAAPVEAQAPVAIAAEAPISKREAQKAATIARNAAKLEEKLAAKAAMVAAKSNAEADLKASKIAAKAAKKASKAGFVAQESTDEEETDQPSGRLPKEIAVFTGGPVQSIRRPHMWVLRKAAEHGDKPYVPIRESVTKEAIICLEDGRPMKMLKRHIRTVYNMSAEEYCWRWDLPANYPMVAPGYALQKSRYARSVGLGSNRMRADVAAKRESMVHENA